MPDSTDNRKSGTPPPSSTAKGASGGGGPGIQFNQVGREEPAREVLTPQIDPALRRRRILFILLAVAALVVLIAVSLLRFGLNEPGGGDGGDRSFDPPERRFE